MPTLCGFLGPIPRLENGTNLRELGMLDTALFVMFMVTIPFLASYGIIFIGASSFFGFTSRRAFLQRSIPAEYPPDVVRKPFRWRRFGAEVVKSFRIVAVAVAFYAAVKLFRAVCG